MIARIAQGIFLACLFPCALMVLVAIWGQDLIPKPLWFQLAASLFVIGLASFLTWFVVMVRRIHARLTGA